MYLESCDLDTYRERLKFIHALLEEDFNIEVIARAVNEAKDYDQALIRHKLYRITYPEMPLGKLNETHTPDSVRRYQPRFVAYNRLMHNVWWEGDESCSRHNPEKPVESIKAGPYPFHLP